MTTPTKEVQLLMDETSKQSLAEEVLKLRSLCRDVYNDYDELEVNQHCSNAIVLIWNEGKP